MNIIYRAVGLLLLVFFAFSDIAFPIRLAGFIITYTAISGIEIGVAKKYGYSQGKEENIGRPVNFGELKPGLYDVSFGPFLGNCPQTGNCSTEFLLLAFAYFDKNSPGPELDCKENTLYVELGIVDRINLKEAIGKIEQGARFGINERGQIEKL